METVLMYGLRRSYVRNAQVIARQHPGVSDSHSTISLEILFLFSGAPVLRHRQLESSIDGAFPKLGGEGWR